MTLIEHLAELRMRIVRARARASCRLHRRDGVLRPDPQVPEGPYERICNTDPASTCENNGLYILSPLEGFSTRITISVYGGIILALPVILWQIWQFIVPGLHKKEKQYAIPFIVSSVALFVLGGGIAYWTLDKALQFLIEFSGPDVRQAFQISKYISFVGLMIAAFGVGLEFPVLLVFLQLVGVLKLPDAVPPVALRHRRHHRHRGGDHAER